MAQKEIFGRKKEEGEKKLHKEGRHNFCFLPHMKPFKLG
jgi:hypothetical protein